VLAVALAGLVAANIFLRRKMRVQDADLKVTQQQLQNEITTRKGHELDLMRFGAVIEQMREGVVITNEDGLVQYVNPAFEHLTGFDMQEVIAGSFNDLFLGPEATDLLDELRSSLGKKGEWRERFMNTRKDGKPYQVEATVSSIYGGSGDVINILAIFRDITHEYELERQLRQSQKLEAIGTLAGGIAHDFNNTLASIMGYTELTLLGMEDDNEHREKLERVLRSGKRARQLVEQILTFSRQSDEGHRKLAVEPIVKETMKLIAPMIPKSIEVATTFEAPGVLIRTDPTRIHQILMNLCTNAAHAIGDSNGRIEVSLGVAEIDRFQVQMSLEPGRYIKLSVRDNGCGMTREVQERVFEPFFTTKKRGEGTGMGLAVVHGIVESHGGAVDLYSETGKGTTFHVFLPTVSGVSEAETEQVEEKPTGTESVLVVDDEEPVSEVLALMLTHLGYQVETRNDSREALTFFEEHSNRFDLLITDYAMPGMVGTELARRVLEICPDLPIILVSGYGQGLTTERVESVGIRDMLPKPVMTGDLARAVRRLLDKKDADIQPASLD
ncbi:PAS domain S-box protein, partial [bacterium]|nr:PAS domain S-box protein [bacterium]